MNFDIRILIFKCRGFFADNDNIYEVHPLHARHQNKMRPIDKRDPEKVFYHIITKKDKAQFKLPENVICK